MVKEKKTPTVTINGETISESIVGEIVYGDVETATVAEIQLGCQHGRRRGQPCPHCMGIGSASPRPPEKIDETPKG